MQVVQLHIRLLTVTFRMNDEVITWVDGWLDVWTDEKMMGETRGCERIDKRNDE